MDQDKKNMLSAATEIAKKEGITDDEALTIRVGEIFEDAQKESPETPAGIEAKKQATDIGMVQKTGIPSPFMQRPGFNYEKLRDDTSIPAITDILGKLGENAAFLAIPSKPTKEYIDASDKAYNKLMMDTFQVLNNRNIGMSEFKFIFDSLKSTITSLEAGIMQQVTGHRHEIMSRLFGTKNPGTDKFDSNYTTYAELVAALEKIRTDTGGKMEDYFTITPQE